MPDHTDSPPARKGRTFALAGVGALVQFMGVVALFGAAFAGLREGGAFVSTAFAAWAGAGFAYCIVLLAVGSELSKQYLCGHCGAPLADKRVTVCPTCKGRLL